MAFHLQLPCKKELPLAKPWNCLWAVSWLLLLPLNLDAQVDSLLNRNQLLKTITISEKSPNQAFNFYRGSKLANTEEILSRVPGMNLIRRGPIGMDPGLRSYQGNQINLTIDGMRMHGACTDRMDPVSIYIEPANLNSIEINQGASGAYSGSTIGGSVNLNLQKPDFSCKHVIQGKYNTSFQSASRGLSQSLILDGVQKKFAWRLSGALRKAGNYTAGGGQEIRYSQYQKWNSALAISYKINEYSLLQVDALVDQGRNIGYPGLSMDVGKANAAILAATHTLDGKQGNQLRTKLYWNNVYHEMDDTKRPETPIHMDMPGWSRTYGIFQEAQAKAGLIHWKARWDYSHTFLKADMTMYPKNEPIMFMKTLADNNQQNAGLFVKAELNAPGFLNPVVWFRYDYNALEVLPGIGADNLAGMGMQVEKPIQNHLKNGGIEFNKKYNKLLLGFKASYAERCPSANERIGFYLYSRADNFDYLGNPTLKPEQALQAEFQVVVEAEQLSWSNQFYFHHTQNALLGFVIPGYSAMTIGAKGVKEWRNLAFANAWGMETVVKWKISHSFSNLNTLRLTSTRNNLGEAMPFTPPLKIMEALSYTRHKWKVQQEFEYASSQHQLSNTFGEKSSPSWFLFHLRFSRYWTLKRGDIGFQFAIENLLDRNYYEHLDFMKIARPGRNFIIGFNLSI